MKHVRILGLGLLAAFIVSAAVAVPAMAKKGYSAATLGQYKGCPYNNPEVENCFAGITSGGSQGGYFQLGGALVKLSKPITLQGGYKGVSENLTIIPAANGYQTLEAPELKVQGGIALITPKIQAEAGWPEALKQSFKEAKKNKETTLNAKIELAGGNLLYETPAALDTERLIGEQGPAFKLPLKVKLTNAWLEKLGGGPCEIGNEAAPIWQYLTTEGSGRAGSFHADYDFMDIGLEGSRLVALNWPVEPASDATGCGSGEDEAYVDAALNIVLEQGYHRLGLTVLQGDTFTAFAPFVKEKYEAGEGE